MLFMRTLLLTVMMLCACLFTPGCTGGEQEEVLCEDAGVLTQYEYFECGVEIFETPEGEECGGPDGEFYVENECYGTLKIEMTNTGDSPVHIVTFVWWEYEAWVDCEPIGLIDGFFEWDSMGTTIEGTVPGPGNLFVVFDHVNSCDEEDASIPNAEISFKVSLVT